MALLLCAFITLLQIYSKVNICWALNFSIATCGMWLNHMRIFYIVIQSIQSKMVWSNTHIVQINKIQQFASCDHEIKRTISKQQITHEMKFFFLVICSVMLFSMINRIFDKSLKSAQWNFRNPKVRHDQLCISLKTIKVTTISFNIV